MDEETPEVAKAVREMTANKGVDLVIDTVNELLKEVAWLDHRDRRFPRCDLRRKPVC